MEVDGVVFVCVFGIVYFDFICRHNVSAAQQECEEQKEIVKTLKSDLEGLTTKLTDLRGGTDC